MKILMFGRGVISTQYAWALEKAGHTVEFYVRQGRKSEYGSIVELNIFDARKKIRGTLVNEKWKIKLREDLDSDYDLIIVSVQHYHFKSVMDILANKIGDSTVLIFNNFWEEPQNAVSKLPDNQLVWGFPGAGGGFDEKGILKGTLFKSVTIGTFGSEPSNRTVEVIKLFKSANLKIKMVTDFRSWLLSHFVVNAAFHLEALKIDKQDNLIEGLQTTQYWRNIIANGKELLPLLKSRNVDIKKNSELKIFNIPPWLISLIMKIAIKYLPSVKRQFLAHSNNIELKSYCKDVMNKAYELNIDLPRYEANRRIYQE